MIEVTNEKKKWNEYFMNILLIFYTAQRSWESAVTQCSLTGLTLTPCSCSWTTQTSLLSDCLGAPTLHSPGRARQGEVTVSPASQTDWSSLSWDSTVQLTTRLAMLQLSTSLTYIEDTMKLRWRRNVLRGLIECGILTNIFTAIRIKYWQSKPSRFFFRNTKQKTG